MGTLWDTEKLCSSSTILVPPVDVNTPRDLYTFVATESGLFIPSKVNVFEPGGGHESLITGSIANCLTTEI